MMPMTFPLPHNSFDSLFIAEIYAMPRASLRQCHVLCMDYPSGVQSPNICTPNQPDDMEVLCPISIYPSRCRVLRVSLGTWLGKKAVHPSSQEVAAHRIPASERGLDSNARAHPHSAILPAWLTEWSATRNNNLRALKPSVEVMIILQLCLSE
jgi:hypothetical protein